MSRGVILPLITLVAILAFVLPVFFVGTGYFLSLFLPLSLFQCALLSLISVVGFALLYHAFITEAAAQYSRLDDFEDPLDFLDDDNINQFPHPGSEGREDSQPEECPF